MDIILFSSDDNIDGGDGIDILLCNSEYDSWEYIENVYNVELLLKVTEGLVFDNWGHGDIWTIPDLLNMTTETAETAAATTATAAAQAAQD